jgi:hypothetical protein
MKSERELRDGLRKCRKAMRESNEKGRGARCWMSGSGSTCCPEECSTRETLYWVLGEEMDYGLED